MISFCYNTKKFKIPDVDIRTDTSILLQCHIKKKEYLTSNVVKTQSNKLLILSQELVDTFNEELKTIIDKNITDIVHGYYHGNYCECSSKYHDNMSVYIIFDNNMYNKYKIFEVIHVEHEEDEYSD